MSMANSTCITERDTLTPAVRRAVQVLHINGEKGIWQVLLHSLYKLTDNIDRRALSRCIHNHNRNRDRRLCIASSPDPSPKTEKSNSATPIEAQLPGLEHTCIRIGGQPIKALRRRIV
jgi:hypothetical protein